MITTIEIITNSPPAINVDDKTKDAVSIDKEIVYE